MMNPHRIGNDFTLCSYLNLLPFCDLPAGYYHCNIEYLCHDKNYETYMSDFKFTSVSQLDILMGRDVRSISVNIFSNTYPHMGQISYNLRADRLILLNLASQLINFKKTY